MTEQPLIAASGLCKNFPGVRALDDVCFELRAGEVHALVGENGAGKSTLMRVLAGIYQPDAGEIRVNGKPLHLQSPRQAQAQGISIIHQELSLMNHLSVASNIFIGREPRKALSLMIDRARMNDEAKKLFAWLGLDLDPREPVANLTVAHQQMVEIAKALSVNARILIMDEPTAALTYAEIADLFAVIRDLKKQGVGIVYISHKMDELRQISDRITVMRDGRYIDTVPTETTSLSQVIQMMVGRTLEETGMQMTTDQEAAVALEVRHLRRDKVLHDISFQVRKGEILGLAGLMGAGRTELARAIFGADPIDGGEIFVHGQKVTIRSPAHAVRCGIGYLSEDRKRFGLVTAMSVRSNAILANMRKFMRLGFLTRQSAASAATQDAVDKLAIKTPTLAQRVALLSGGNQQKIVIAKWLIRDCDILLFDEPTRGIDIGSKREIYRLLHELAAQGKAIVMISSELPEVLYMSQRILVMCEGHLTGDLSIAEATQERIMHLATQRTIH